MTSVERLETRLAKLSGHGFLGRPVRLYFRYREQTLYLFVGGWNTLFGYAIWALLYFLLRSHLHYLIILVLSWPFAVINAYVGYRMIVFRSNASVWRELPRFSMVYVATLASALIALPILVRTLPFNLYVIQAMYTGVAVVLSYIGHKYFSFKKGHRRSAPHPDEKSIA
jgi:putative flippase GtrA